MFRTEAQQAAVCETLCRLVRLPGLWTTGGHRLPGPTDRAIALLKQRGGTMSHGEWLMVAAAWDTWNGRGGLKLADALATLDGNNLRALGSMLVAIAEDADAVDRWLAHWTPSGPAPTAP